MTAAIRALLSRIVDYAGLFPPAKLDMAPTVRNYARYVTSDDSWMLGRLIIPVIRLEEFEREAAGLLPYAGAKSRNDEVGGWQISALAEAPAGSDQLETDLAKIEAFNARHASGAAAVIDVIEIKASSAAGIDRALDELPEDLFPFFEIPIDPDPRGLIAAMAEADAGAKVRTGGTSADLYPSTASLARFIAACARASVPFKATAGLHHPLRHWSEAVKGKEHGFLNVFLAGVLARIHALPVAEIVGILESESLEAGGFTIGESEISWRGKELSLDDLAEAREDFAVSFGSCSFDEPLQDLRAMKLL